MKKFHFYLMHTEMDDITCGADVGASIRRWRGVYWNKKETKGRSDVVKVTLWLSQEKLKSFKKAKLSGCVYLQDMMGKPLKYSHKRVIEAIQVCDCEDGVYGDTDPCIWFARAKVEKV